MKQLIKMNQTHIRQADHMIDKTVLMKILDRFVLKKREKRKELKMKRFLNQLSDNNLAPNPH
jgi:hypothetical protein